MGLEWCGSSQYIEVSFDSHWGNVCIRKFNILFYTHTFPISFQPLLTSASFYQKRTHADLRNSKKIHGFVNTLDFLGIS